MKNTNGLWLFRFLHFTLVLIFFDNLVFSQEEKGILVYTLTDKYIDLYHSSIIEVSQKEKKILLIENDCTQIINPSNGSVDFSTRHRKDLSGKIVYFSTRDTKKVLVAPDVYSQKANLYFVLKDSIFNGEFIRHISNIGSRLDIKEYFNSNVTNKELRIKNIKKLAFDHSKIYFSDKDGKKGIIHYSISDSAQKKTYYNYISVHKAEEKVQFVRDFVFTKIETDIKDWDGREFKADYGQFSESYKRISLGDSQKRPKFIVVKRSYTEPSKNGITDNEELYVYLMDSYMLNRTFPYTERAITLYKSGYYEESQNFFRLAKMLNPNDCDLNFYLLSFIPNLNDLVNESRGWTFDSELFYRVILSDSSSYSFSSPQKENIANLLDNSMSTDDIDRKDSLLEILSALYFNDRIIDKFYALHEKYGFSKNVEKEQLLRMGILNVVAGHHEKAQEFFKTLNDENDLKHFYLGVIDYTNKEYRSALSHFQASYSISNNNFVFFNIIQTEIKLRNGNYCNTLIILKEFGGWWHKAAYNLLYEYCDYSEFYYEPIYREERYDAGGYTNENGTYIPDYQTRKIEINTEKNEVNPYNIQFPSTDIFISI